MHLSLAQMICVCEYQDSVCILYTVVVLNQAENHSVEASLGEVAHQGNDCREGGSWRWSDWFDTGL